MLSRLTSFVHNNPPARAHLPVGGELGWTTRAVSGKKLWMHPAQRIQGRLVEAKDILWLRRWVDFHPHWSRKRLARELCLQWQWLDGRGRLKDFAARSFLLKLEGQGQIRLPALQANKCRVRRGVEGLASWQEPPVLKGGLEETKPLRLELVGADTAEQRAWAFYLDRYHYLGLRVVGENIGYLVKDHRGRDLTCLLFGAAAWCCGPRDRALGWGRQERQERLSEIANNTRFLILPWVRVPHLASHVLGRVARRIDRDWREKYGHGLRWLETFVQRQRFAGTCYRAANWQCVGQTQGRSRQDREHRTRVPVKDVYLYALAGGDR